MQHVFLVPGFFGFQTLGDMPYFAHVGDELERRLLDLKVRARVLALGIPPTASLRLRAARLADLIAAAVKGTDGPIHLVGHSSGGLDLRLLVTPSATLPTITDVEALASRTVTLTTVSTPHAGTPLAGAFTSVAGQRLLSMLSRLTARTLRFGHTPLRGAVWLGRILIRLDDVVGMRGPVLDQLYEQLIGDFSRERSRSLQEFLGHVGDDQALLPQLTPAGMDLFNATTKDREGIRYGSVVSLAHPPGLRTARTVGWDPYGQGSQLLYQLLYRVTSRMPESALPPLRDDQVEALVSGFGEIPSAHANDGMVPTRSQVWGRIIHSARADHLDVMGYFDDPPHVDWLATGTGFNRQRFHALWGAVARYIAET